MTDFWPLAMLLVLLALLFVVVPLLLKPRLRGVQRDALNVRVIRDQLVELQADLEAGRLDQSAYADARHDLERELLDDVNVDSASVDADAGRGRWLMVVLLVLVPVTAVSIYQQIGVPDARQRQAAVTTVAPPSADADAQHSVEEMIASLAARMQQDPGNVEGWILLGRSYVAMNRYSDAAEAYRRALQLSGDDAELLSNYADVLVTANNGEFTDQVGEALERALAADPQHVKALWLRGHWKIRRGDSVGAVEDWQMAMTLLPPGDQNIPAIQQQISDVQARSAKPATAGSTGAPVAANVIKVQVVLDPALADSASPEDIVFIFARAIQGPRMPLAAVRKRVADLPVTVTLDDSLAMSPAMVLSNFDQVLVGARISKTGQPISASGDLQGSVSPVEVAGGQVQVLIDQLVP